jgi:uncharacterized membrane protein YoaK (UPF0700 family)
LSLPDRRDTLFEERRLSFAKANQDKEPSPPEDSNDGPSPFLSSPYTRREYTFTIFVGVLLAFNAGYVNGSCITGLIAPSGTQQAVTSNTGTVTKSALALSRGDTRDCGFLVSMGLCFALGSFIAGFLTPQPRPFRLEATYGPTFLIGAVFLSLSSALAALEVEQEQFIFYLAAAANGIQNGISSIYSSNLIRSTGITGTSTDIGILIGQHLRGNRKETWRLIVLLSLWTSFGMGGFVSFYATSAFMHFSLLFNAGLYLLIGGGLVVFLHKELNVTFLQALFGITMSCDKKIQEGQRKYDEREASKKPLYDKRKASRRALYSQSTRSTATTSTASTKSTASTTKRPIPAWVGKSYQPTDKAWCSSVHDTDYEC